MAVKKKKAAVKPAASKTASKKAAPKKSIQVKAAIKKKAAPKKSVQVKAAIKKKTITKKNVAKKPIVKKLIPKKVSAAKTPIKKGKSKLIRVSATEPAIIPINVLIDHVMKTEDPIRAFDKKAFKKATAKADPRHQMLISSKSKKTNMPSAKKPLWRK